MLRSFEHLLLISVFVLSINQIGAHLSFRKAQHDGACGVRAAELSSREVEPAHYTLALDLDLNKPKFAGSVEIDVAIVGRNEERANEIWLNADKSLDIKAIRYEAVGGGSGPSMLSSSLRKSTHNIEVLEACLNTEHQVLVLTLADELQAGTRGRLNISYEGHYSESGLHKYPSRADESHPDVSISREAHGIRLVLPCFDNSHLESTFKLIVRRYPHLNAISNTDRESDLIGKDGISKVVTFMQTPPIRLDELKLEMRV